MSAKRASMSLRSSAINKEEVLAETNTEPKPKAKPKPKVTKRSTAKKTVEQTEVKEVKTVKQMVSMTTEDKALLEELELKLMLKGVKLNKSEIMRAGLIALNTITEKQFEKVATSVTKLSVGRPKK